MLGISYGELFLLLGATAAFIGPKDLPIIARTMGRLAGRSIGYVQLARGQFDSVMQQSQARQVHKELQDTMAQLEAIRHEIRSISFVNPGPLTRRLVDNLDQISTGNERDVKEGTSGVNTVKDHISVVTDMQSQLTTDAKDMSFTSASLDSHSQATSYAKLAKSGSINSGTLKNSDILAELTDESGHVIVLPVSAETAELLPERKDDVKGSDIVLEAVLEAEVARNAKEFFSQPQNLKM